LNNSLFAWNWSSKKFSIKIFSFLGQAFTYISIMEDIY